MTVDACRHALLHNMGVAARESVLIVTDPSMLPIGEALQTAALGLTPAVRLDVIPRAERNGQEPPPGVAARMAGVDVVLLAASKSLSWTDARVAATSRGTRVGSMTAITGEILRRTLTVDYDAIRWRANRLCDRLDRAEEVSIRSPSGTDLRLSVAGRTAHGRKGGIYREPGHWGNLPCGEAFIAPLEGSAAGVYVVDASHGGVGPVDVPIRITVESGVAVKIEGGRSAAALQALLQQVRDPAAFEIAEFGIGTNHAARICGVTLEDEKVLGTCHLALGRNDLFGGTIRVDSHVDGVIRDPTILFDGEVIVADQSSGVDVSSTIRSPVSGSKTALSTKASTDHGGGSPPR